jgi:hypothetical protein
MANGIQFRKTLPVVQTALALALGGWGLWIRNTILSRPFMEGTTLRESTARFHVWPWPFKFTAVLNMPAFLVGGLLSLPLGALYPALANWISIVLILLFVVLLWYWVGARLDNSPGTTRKWILLLTFGVTCAAASSLPRNVGGYVSYVPLGIVVWLLALVAIGRSKASRIGDP